MELSEEINTLSRLIKSAFIRIKKTNLSFTEDFDKQKIKELYAFKKKNKKTKRTKWETINHLYKDLKYNQMQKQFPFYYSEKGDSTMLNLFQKIDEEKE